MPSCEYCGDTFDDFAFVCSYCEEAHCQDHRLPESHDCPDLHDVRPPTSAQDESDAFVDASRGATASADIDLGNLRERAADDRGAEAYSVVEVEQTVGTKPDPDLASSPDVAPDGSVGSNKSVTVDVSDSRESISINRTAIIVALAILIGILVAGLL